MVDPASVPEPSRPLAFVYNWVPAYRRGLMELLAERQGAEYLLFGGRALHPQDLKSEVKDLRAPARIIGQRGVFGAILEGNYRGVIASTNGRVALPAAYWAARRAGIPFVLWATMWRHPRTLAHAFSRLPMRWIYSHADAVVTYGPHVSRYVSRFRDGRNVFEAPQATDNELMGAPPAPDALRAVTERAGGDGYLLFVGRLVPAKGVRALATAWGAVRAQTPEARLVVAGEGPLAGELQGLEGVTMLGRVSGEELPAWYAGARAVLVPSIPTRAFLEPWGYVVNEAFLQGTPVVATDAVGAAAGGLVEDSVNGLIVPAGDAQALAAAAGRLLAGPALAGRLGDAGREKVAAFTHTAQAAGFERALAACGLSRHSE